MFRTTGQGELGSCPAAVEIDEAGKPTIIINRDRFGLASDFEQRFYIAHELGHYIMQSGNEEVADAFALGALAGTEKKSLKQSLAALYAMPTIPYERLEAMERRCEQIDRNHKKLTDMAKQNLNKMYNANMLRADGEMNPTQTTTEAPAVAEQTMADAATAASVIGDIIVGNNRRRAGIRVNNVFFSLESIVLSALLIVTIIIACKK